MPRGGLGEWGGREMWEWGGDGREMHRVGGGWGDGMQRRKERKAGGKKERKKERKKKGKKKWKTI